VRIPGYTYRGPGSIPGATRFFENNRTHDLPAFSIVPQPIMLPRAPIYMILLYNVHLIYVIKVNFDVFILFCIFEKHIFDLSQL
jgi:hypothetical protein